MAADMNIYWNGNGRYQKEKDKVCRKLRPEEGPRDSLQGEVLRAALALYDDFHEKNIMVLNNREWQNVLSEGAWGFLSQVSEGNFDEGLSRISNIVYELPDASGEEDYADILEHLMDEAVLYAMTFPLVPNEDDMADFMEACAEECCLSGYGEEEELEWDEEGNEIEKDELEEEDWDDDGDWDDDEDGFNDEKDEDY